MRIALAADHAGFHLKERIGAHLAELGHDPVDLGTHGTAAVDYPDFAEAVGRAVQERRPERGILVCGSGVGASIAVNKIAGIRAGLCHDHYSAHQGVEHDNMNVLVLGGRVIGEALALELVDAFLAAQFTGELRRRRRLAKIARLEQAQVPRGRTAPGNRPKEPQRSKSPADGARKAGKKPGPRGPKRRGDDSV